MPKTALFKLNMDEVMMRPNTLTVRAFDGSRRSVEGEVDLPVKIGPHIFYLSFYVMDIRPYYTCLLGRPWIHLAGAVTSTLHQKLKFVVDSKIIVIGGEEDVIVNNATTYSYVEVEGEIHETPFQALEIVSVDRFPVVKEEKKSEAPLSSLIDAKALVEAGIPHGGWGKIVEVTEKRDKFGIGYQPSSSTLAIVTPPLKGSQILPLQEVFVSGGTSQEEEQVLAVGDEDDHYGDISNFIYQIAPDQELNNWIALDIPQVVFLDM